MTFLEHVLSAEKRGKRMMVNRDKREKTPPVSGSEAELHCSVAAAVWLCLPSDSHVLIFATIRGETRNRVTKELQTCSCQHTSVSTDISIRSTRTWLLIT